MLRFRLEVGVGRDRVQLMLKKRRGRVRQMNEGAELMPTQAVAAIAEQIGWNPMAANRKDVSAA